MRAGSVAGGDPRYIGKIDDGAGTRMIIGEFYGRLTVRSAVGRVFARRGRPLFPRSADVLRGLGPGRRPTGGLIASAAGG